VGVGALGLAASGAAVSWMTFPEELVVEEGVGFEESPPAVRVTTIDGVPKLETDDPEGDAGVLLGFAARVSDGTLLDEVDEVADGWPLDRNCERMLEASVGETVVVVVVLAEPAVTVTVTVTSLELPLVVDVEDEDEVVLDDVVLDDVVVLTLSEPVTPPLTPAAFIRATTVLSLVQSRDVPAARTLGMAKHC
jgi:hypothetical protein